MTARTNNRLNGRHPTADDPPRLVDFETERAALGCMQFGCDSDLLTEDLFALPEHRVIFGALVRLKGEGEPADVLTLAHALAREGSFGAVGGAPKLIEIMESVPHAAHIDYYARILRELHTRRKLVEIRERQLQAAISGDLAEAAEGTDLQHDLPNKFAPVSIGQLIGQHPKLDPPIVDRLIREGETANLVASSKVGKSWLAAGLSLSVATGRDWLGFSCQRGRVLLVDNELKPGNIAFRMRSVADAMAIKPAEYETSIDVLSLRGRIRPIQDLASQLRQLRRQQYKLAIIDSWYRCLDDTSENDAGVWRESYNLIDSLAEEMSCGFVLVLHSSKGSQSDKRTTDVGSGSGVQSRAPDAHIVLREHENEGQVVLDANVRSFAPIDPIVLSWTFPVWTRDDDADPKALARPKSAKERQQAADDAETQSEVLSILTDESQPLSEYGVTKLSTFHKDRVRRAIQALLKADRIEIAEAIQKPNGKLAVYYQTRRTVETDDQHGRSESGASVTQSEGMTVRTPKGRPPVCHTPRQTGDPEADGRDQQQRKEGEENNSPVSGRPPP